MKKVLIALLLIIFLISAGISIYMLYDYYHGASYTTGTVAAATPAPTPEQTPQPTQTPEQAYKDLSPNAVGWLKIPAADIDDPVMQTDDNEFYLDHNEQDEYDIWGSFFFSCDNSIDPENLDRMTLIFGHANGNATHLKFSTLKRFKDVDFASQNQFIELSFGDTTTRWQIFSECEFPVSQQTIMNVNPDDPTWENEITLMQQLSYNHYDVDVTKDDKILILATCTGIDNYDYRYLVCAKLVN